MFIEEPVLDPGAVAPFWERMAPTHNVTVFRAHTNIKSPGFCYEQLAVMQQMLPQLVKNEELVDYVVWLYTPLALPLARSLSPAAVVYDCMDELSMFKGAPPALLTREIELLRWADVVFTGGQSLYRAKLGRHGNLHCFPSSVDAAHFGPALQGIEAPDQQPLPHPRLGFFGVIDERMDLALLDALARAHPAWQIIMVGPVVKIDPAELPRHANLHYLGGRNYDQLPAYLAGWDVCLLPFAQNDATRFISPTKTLEYMAAERMIVSTPITDVVEPYSEIVYLGGTAPAFINACEHALQTPAAERAERILRMRKVLAQTSWARTAEAMQDLIDEAVTLKARPSSQPPLRDVQAAAAGVYASYTND